MACLIGIQTIALSCIKEIIKQEIKQGVQQGNFTSWLFSFSPSSLLSTVGEGSFNVSCKRRFRELKTADEEKALKKNPKSTRYVPKSSCYKLFQHSALHSPSTETKAATRLFKRNVYYRV